jgi:hypothetical protein
MSAVVIPPGGTFFDTMKRSFADVPINTDDDNGIATTEFLEAAEAMTTIFDLLGSVAFSPVKSDLLGNIRKLRERQLAAPEESKTLQALVLSELGTNRHRATEGLVWLVRGLDFTAQALRHNISVPADELSSSFRTAYESTLKPHHGFMIRPIFSAAMSATPYRKDFYAKLGGDPAKAHAALDECVDALETRVKILKAFQERKEAQW